MLKRVKDFLWGDAATVAVEAAMLFPILVGIMCGSIDLGIGLITNQKVINATQTVSDLLTRYETVSDANINDAIVAGQLALAPYDISAFGVDIAGVQFIGVNKVPTVQWRVTQGMEENPDIIENSEDLGDENEGVIAVTVTYTYTPLFTEGVVGTIVMKEESYARGRAGGFVDKS